VVADRVLSSRQSEQPAAVLGSLLAPTPVLAVAILFAACVGAAVVSAVHPLGRLAMLLAVPLMAAGFSYRSLADSAPRALLIITGSGLTWLVSLLWPERSIPPHRYSATQPSRESMARYGVRLGVAGAICAAAGSRSASTMQAGPPLRA
jgi:hypothetical protein